MVRRGVFVFFLILFLGFVSSFGISGNVADNPVSVSISVTGATPSITIIHPENKTYLYTQNFPFNFTSDGDNFWYSLDGSSNTSISGNTTFDLSEGLHTIDFYSNNSYGFRKSSISFTNNLTLLSISFSEYNGSTRGDSTDLIKTPYEDLQNLSDLVLENTFWGKIVFHESINVTNDSNSNDGVLDMDSNTQISLSRAEINSTALPNFAKPATITLYNVPLNNPRLLKNGEVCSSSECTFLSFAGGVYVFNVTSFDGNYLVEETPTSTTTTITISSGGGGGGGTRTIIQGFEERIFVDKEELKVSLKQGGISRQYFEIENILDEKIEVELEVSNSLEDMVKLSEYSFELENDQSKIIAADIFALEDLEPGIYFGRVTFKSGDDTKALLIVVEVESSGALFDVEATIPPQFLKLHPGEDLVSEIVIYDIGNVDLVDFLVEYIIEDLNGNIIYREEEMLAVETRVGYLKEIELPDDISLGKYLYYVNVQYDDKTASSSVLFSVVSGIPLGYYLIAGVFLLLLLLIIIIALRRKCVRLREEKKECPWYCRKKGCKNKNKTKKKSLKKNKSVKRKKAIKRKTTKKKSTKKKKK